MLWYTVKNMDLVCFHNPRTLALCLGFLRVLEFLCNSSQNKSYSNTCEGHDRHLRGELKKISDDDEPPANPF